MSKERIQEIKKQRRWAHDTLLKRDSQVYQAFLEMEQAAFGDGQLSPKVKELIAIGISVVINCESCMQWHVEQAVKVGATQQEVLEALGVAMEMGGGPATASARFALEVIDQLPSSMNKD
jgi:AhpD family alkylhydroperoxidase